MADRATYGEGPGPGTLRAVASVPMDAHLLRGVPPCPPEALDWLAGPGGRRVLVLGDDRLCPALAERGHEVVREPGQPPRSVDVVLATDAAPTDLLAVAGSLRPGGHIALLVSDRDHRIPWARKLDRAVGAEIVEDPAAPLVHSRYFGWVEEQVHRSMVPVNRDTLPAFLDRLPALAALEAAEKDARLGAALELYDDYGRGVDGMQLPLVHRCYRAEVVADAVPAPTADAEPEASGESGEDEPATGEPGSAGPTGDSVEGGQVFTADDFDDSGMLLIDFR